MSYIAIDSLSIYNSCPEVMQNDATYLNVMYVVCVTTHSLFKLYKALVNTVWYLLMLNVHIVVVIPSVHNHRAVSHYAGASVLLQEPVINTGANNSCFSGWAVEKCLPNAV